MLEKTLKDNKIFFIPYFFLLLFSSGILLYADKADLHLYINRFHTTLLDFLFVYITYLGDGWFILIPALILLLFSLRHSLYLISVYLSAGLVTQLLKRIFFEGMARPSKLLEGTDLYIVKGVNMLTGRSFPSGHATSAFGLFLCLALITRNNTLKVICLVMACLVAFSRVYLSQHFLNDVVAGSIIGSAGAVSFYLVYYKDERRWHEWSIKKAFSHEKKF